MVEASGNVFVTHSDKMDNLVVKGIAVAFNNMNSVFAATMKDADQLLAAVSMHAVCAYATHTHTHTHTHAHTHTHTHNSCEYALTIRTCVVCILCTLCS